MKKIKDKRKKAEKASLKQRIKNFVREGIYSITAFFKNNKKAVITYGLAYFTITLLSVILTGIQDGSLQEAPLVFLNIVPRLLTMFMLTAPAFIFSRRRTIFTVGAAVWAVWQLAAAGCRISWILLAASMGIILSGIFWFIDNAQPCYSHN